MLKCLTAALFASSLALAAQAPRPVAAPTLVSETPPVAVKVSLGAFKVLVERSAAVQLKCDAPVGFTGLGSVEANGRILMVAFADHDYSLVTAGWLVDGKLVGVIAAPNPTSGDPDDAGAIVLGVVTRNHVAFERCYPA